MDDVTIEDEIDLDGHVPPSVTQTTQKSLLFQLVNQPWFILIFCLLITLCWMFRKRRNIQQVGENPSSANSVNVDRYEQMERIRQRQQKEYEEQARRRLEKKQAQLEAMKESNNDNATRTKFRSTDHNPLMGQSTRNDGGSCSWRPSSRRKPAGG